MSATDQMRQMLDQLMGTTRNGQIRMCIENIKTSAMLLQLLYERQQQ